MPITKEELTDLENFANQTQTTTTHGWKNFSRNISQPEALVLDIQNIISLQKIMKKIDELNSKKSSEERIIIRTSAGGRTDISHSESYSFTPINEANVILRLVGKEFTDIQVVDNDKQIVRVGSSLQIGELDQALYANHNLSIPTSSLIPYVTVGGLTATSGHGTGREQPSFPGLVKSMSLCLANGDLVTINENDPEFLDIRGGHLGLFGIVLSVDLQCIPAQKLACVMETRSVPEFISEVRKGLFRHDPYVSVMYVPTYLSDEKTNKTANNVIIYRWRPVDKTEENVNFHPTVSRVQQDIEMHLNDGLGIDELITQYPKLIPPYMRYLVSKVKIGTKDQISVGPWPDMAHYQTAYPKDLDEIAALFEVNDNTNQGKYDEEIVTAFEKVVDTLQTAAKKNLYPLTYAIYFRYFQGTNGGLSTSKHAANHHVCAIDMTSHPRTPGFSEFKNDMRDFFVNEMHGKLHWGKNLSSEINYKKMYGDHFTAFKQTLLDWHLKHKLDIKKSPLLNDVFCEVLQLPYRSNNKHITQSLESMSPNQPKAVEELLSKIDKKTKEGKTLCKNIELIVNSNTLSNHPQSIFCHPIKHSTNQVKEGKKSRCTII